MSRCELPGADNGLLKGCSVSESLAGLRFSHYPRYVTHLHPLFGVYLRSGAGSRRRTKPDGPRCVLAEFEFHLLVFLIDFAFPCSLSSYDRLCGFSGENGFLFLLFVFLFLSSGSSWCGLESTAACAVMKI